MVFSTSMKNEEEGISTPKVTQLARRFEPEIRLCFHLGNRECAGHPIWVDIDLTGGRNSLSHRPSSLIG
jgi:hypothetical protein